MAAGVAAAAELGRRLFTPWAGLTTGLILCTVPNTSRYAAEARPYAFACFFSVFALLLLVAAMRRGGPYRWTGYGLSVLLLGLFHLVALTTLAAHAVLVALHAREGDRRSAAIWAATVAAAMVPLLPIAYLGHSQRDIQLHWVDPITVGGLYAMPGQIAGTDHYLRRQAGAPADPLVRVPSAQTGHLIADEHPDAARHVAGAARIWLVVGDRRDDPVTARPDLAPVLAAGYRQAGFWQPERATVDLYERHG